MRWLKLLLIGCVIWTANTEDPHREERGLTWAEILGGAPPRPIETTVPASYAPNEISRTQTDAKDPSPVEDEYATDYNYDYNYEYDESFFENPEYEYVDTEDENYVPPPKVEKEANEGNQTAERRTLDFFYHLFRDQFRNGENEGRESTPRRPSLIEEVFETIDNHILEDLREWTNDPVPQSFKHGKKNKKALATPSIEPVTPDNNIVLITDEQGNQQIVTIHDIVSSLSHLDEQTLTNLILNPSFNERSSQSYQVPNFVASGSENVPVTLNTQSVVHEEVARPARHTGSTSTPEEEEEVYVVRDEHGNIQLITLDNIISSLSLLDDDSLHSLLFEDATLSAAAPTASQNSVSQSVSKPVVASSNIPASVLPKATTTTTTEPPPTPKSTTPTTPVPRPTTLTTQAPKSAPALSDNTTPREPVIPKQKPPPSVSHDKHGNLRVLAHPGSVTLDLKDLSWKANDKSEIEPATPAPLYIDGSLVKTDINGNIHITPNGNQPFPLDIQRIISIAEQANSPIKPDAETLQQEISTEEPPNRGQELLSYLAGIENFLPAAIAPRPVRETTQYSKSSPDGPAGVNSFRESLLEALNHQRTPQKPTTPQPPVQPLIQRLVQPVVQPIVQPIVQAVTSPASQFSSSGGIGATLSNLLSSLVGQPTVQHTKVVPQTVAKTPEEEEFIKIIVRQQAPNSLDTTFGDVTIPLPKAIHFRPTPTPQPETTTEAQISSRLDIPSPWQALSPLIQRSLQLQANSVPVFIPPGARVQPATQKPVAAARSDSGPIFRTDKASVKAKQPAARQDPAPLLRNKILSSLVARADRRSSDSHNTNRRSGSGPILRTNRNTPIRVITKEVETPKPSLSSVLKGLPPSVLESLRKQAQGSRTALASNLENNEEEEEEIDEESDTAPRQKRQPGNTRDRSSYAEDPQYSHGSTGYGYGPDGGTGDPWFDIYLLADLTKVYKVGDSNLSVKSPIIGDPSYFVDTRHHDHYY